MKEYLNSISDRTLRSLSKFRQTLAVTDTLANLNPINWWDRKEWFKFLGLSGVGGIVIGGSVVGTQYLIKDNITCPSQLQINRHFQQYPEAPRYIAALLLHTPIELVVPTDESYARATQARIDLIKRLNVKEDDIKVVKDPNFTEGKSGTSYLDKEICRAQFFSP